MKKKKIVVLASMMFLATVSFAQKEQKEHKEQKEQKEMTVKECVDKGMRERSLGEKVVDHLFEGSRRNREATIKRGCQLDKLKNK